MSSMSSDEEDNTGKLVSEEQLDAILKDPLAKAALLKKIGLDDPGTGTSTSQRSTPSGTSTGAWPSFPPGPYWPGLFPPFPRGPAATAVPTRMEGRGAEGMEAGTSNSRSGEEEEDTIDLDDPEALELVEFDPKVKPADTWEAPQSILKFLDKHFNRILAEEEREAINPLPVVVNFISQREVHV